MTKMELEYASSLSILPYKAIEGTSMEKDWHNVQSGSYAMPAEEPAKEEVAVTAPEHPANVSVPAVSAAPTTVGLSIGFQGGGKTAS